jgi:hypothetical protein
MLDETSRPSGDGHWDVKGLTGFSLRFNVAEDLSSATRAQVVLESLVHDRTLIVQMRSTQIPRHAHVVEYRVQRADGRPLPNWLERIGPDVMMGARPADSERIDLKVTAILSDGTAIHQDVVIRTATGEIQPLGNPQLATALPGFSDQLDRAQAAAQAATPAARSDGLDELQRALAR